MSAAVTSMSVMASHCSTIQSGLRSTTSLRTRWRKMPALAKNSGASQRKITMSWFLLGRPDSARRRGSP